MENKLRIFKGRTNTLSVSVGFDASGDSFVSEIRKGKASSSDILATWDISFATDGTDGELVFVLDDAVTTAIAVEKGYMDVKRIVGGEPVALFDDIIEVFFRDTVTA